MRVVPKEIKEILLSVSSELNQPYDLVEDVYFHEFQYAGEQIKKGEKNNPSTFENILLKHFGSFISNDRHIIKLKMINDEKNRIKREKDQTIDG
jgi:hypothetical protein